MEDVTDYEHNLLARLRDPSVVIADVYAYLEYQDRSDLLPTQFFAPDDLANYQSALAWWPKQPDGSPYAEMDIRWRTCPPLETLCFNYAEAWHGNLTTFIQRLSWLAQQAQAWVTENVKQVGRPRVHENLPGESDAERTKRLNREAVARQREKARAEFRLTPRGAAIASAEQRLKEAQAQKRDLMSQWTAYIAQLKAELAKAKELPNEGQ